MGTPEAKTTRHDGRPNGSASSIDDSPTLTQRDATGHRRRVRSSPATSRSTTGLDSREATEPELQVASAVALDFGLSNREAEVLAAAASGLSTKETAVKLSIRGKTVEYFWAKIFKKLGCCSKLEAMAILLRRATANRIDRLSLPASCDLPVSGPV
jgi:DNA-binding CsgD family transcriptional regulator